MIIKPINLIHCVLFFLVAHFLYASPPELFPKPPHLDSLKNTIAPSQCQSTREFITTFEFFKHHSEYGFSTQLIFKISHEVSNGCTNAAKRFLKIFQLLTRANMSSLDAIRIAKAFISKTSTQADVFFFVFKTIFFKDQFDLSLNTAFTLTQYLLKENYPEGILEPFQKTFKTISDACLNTPSLDLSKKDCALLSIKLSKFALKYQKPLGALFLKTLSFLQDAQQAHLVFHQALQLNTRIFSKGPQAADNFMTAFQFVRDHEKGLNFSIVKAISFGLTMVQRTIKKQQGTSYE